MTAPESGEQPDQPAEKDPNRAFVKPPRDLRQMTDEERLEWSQQLWQTLMSRMDPDGIKRATWGKTPKPDAGGED